MDETWVPETFEMRLAEQLMNRRIAKGWSLDQLAEASGMSRSTLSRIERGDTSPTASQLGLLACCYNVTIAQLIAFAEKPSAQLIKSDAQTVWIDPSTGFERRGISPPLAGFHSEMIRGFIPVGQEISYAQPQVKGMEQYIYLLDGELKFYEGDGEQQEFHLFPGDCLRIKLFHADRFISLAAPGATYILVVTVPDRT
jgi:transcriptional regulator with XRE-family HTH domain